MLGQLLTNGAKYNVISKWSEKDPDHHMIQGVVGLDYEAKDYTGKAGGFVIATPNGTDCEGAMIRIVPLPTACSEVPAMLPQGSKVESGLGKVSLYTLTNYGGQVLLIPAKDSCVAVSITTARG